MPVANASTTCNAIRSQPMIQSHHSNSTEGDACKADTTPHYSVFTTRTSHSSPPEERWSPRSGKVTCAHDCPASTRIESAPTSQLDISEAGRTYLSPVYYLVIN